MEKLVLEEGHRVWPEDVLPRPESRSVEGTFQAFLDRCIAEDDAEGAAPTPPAEVLSRAPNTRGMYRDNALSDEELDGFREACRRLRWRTRGRPFSVLRRRLHELEMRVNTDSPAFDELRTIMRGMRDNPLGSPDPTLAAKAAVEAKAVGRSGASGAGGRVGGAGGRADVEVDGARFDTSLGMATIEAELDGVIAAPEFVRQSSQRIMVREFKCFDIEYARRCLGSGWRIWARTKEGKSYARNRKRLEGFPDMMRKLRENVPRMREKGGKSEEEIAELLRSKEAQEAEFVALVLSSVEALEALPEYQEWQRGCELCIALAEGVAGLLETEYWMNMALRDSGVRHVGSGSRFEEIVAEVAWDRVLAVLKDDAFALAESAVVSHAKDAVIIGAKLLEARPPKGKVPTRPAMVGEGDILLMQCINPADPTAVDSSGFATSWRVVALIECKADVEDIGAAIHQWEDKLSDLLAESSQHYFSVQASKIGGELMAGVPPRSSLKFGRAAFEWFLDGDDAGDGEGSETFFDIDGGASDGEDQATMFSSLPQAARKRLFIASIGPIDPATRVGLDSASRNALLRLLWTLDDCDLDDDANIELLLDVARTGAKGSRSTDQAFEELAKLGLADNVLLIEDTRLDTSATPDRVTPAVLSSES